MSLAGFQRMRRKVSQEKGTNPDKPFGTSYEHMTNKDLKSLAGSQGVEVHARMKKADIIEALRGE